MHYTIYTEEWRHLVIRHELSMCKVSNNCSVASEIIPTADKPTNQPTNKSMQTILPRWWG